MKIKDELTALSAFEEAAVAHADATESGDFRTANRNSDRIVKAAAFLNENEELHRLSALLQHE